MASKYFTDNLPPPLKLELTDKASVKKNWLRFQRQWDNYVIASRMNIDSDQFQVAVFLTCVGDDANDVLDGRRLQEIERDSVQKLHAIFSEYCQAKLNETFERSSSIKEIKWKGRQLTVTLQNCGK
ncbi:30S ribosomal protein s7p [Plakobranchus ocellatus]|uniref:30S ribosomal protein s7p n=1 Tax=Plakobranchus ocellatus TaxID=259542 RepID=A0AAV3XPS7_9GAST|nr:30S ribosomal protein s7p [Plakobranchus ocellatus]